VSIYLDDDDAKVALGLLAAIRSVVALQAGLSVPALPALASVGAGMTTQVDHITALLRSRDVDISPEEQERHFLRFVALTDQLAGRGGGGA
jgi:hypothetical protein